MTKQHRGWSIEGKAGQHIEGEGGDRDGQLSLGLRNDYWSLLPRGSIPTSVFAYLAELRVSTHSQYWAWCMGEGPTSIFKYAETQQQRMAFKHCSPLRLNAIVAIWRAEGRERGSLEGRWEWGKVSGQGGKGGWKGGRSRGQKGSLFVCRLTPHSAIYQPYVVGLEIIEFGLDNAVIDIVRNHLRRWGTLIRHQPSHRGWPLIH